MAICVSMWLTILSVSVRVFLSGINVLIGRAVCPPWCGWTSFIQSGQWSLEQEGILQHMALDFILYHLPALLGLKPAGPQCKSGLASLPKCMSQSPLTNLSTHTYTQNTWHALLLFSEQPKMGA